MDITEEERALILANRQKAIEIQAQKVLMQTMLEIAARYEAWLQEQGCRSSFSTFVNEFGYDKNDSQAMFRYVEHLRGEARAFAGRI